MISKLTPVTSLLVFIGGQIFNQPNLAVSASRDVLADVWHVLLTTLIDPRLPALEDGSQIMRAFNVLVVRMAEKAHFTNMFR